MAKRSSRAADSRNIGLLYQSSRWALRATLSGVSFELVKAPKMRANMKESFFLAVASNRPHILNPFLLESPSCLEFAWQDDFRALHWAALYGCQQSVVLLLEHGADPKALLGAPEICPEGDSNVWYDFEMRRLHRGWSARDLAINGGFPEIAEVLAQAGAPYRVTGPSPQVETWRETARGQRALARRKMRSYWQV